ncbi:hypothetical protein EMIT079MI2_300042 [Bacillus sp. IT-79MI2]
MAEKRQRNSIFFGEFLQMKITVNYRYNLIMRGLALLNVYRREGGQGR